MISWTSGRENSPMEEARMEEECLRRRSRSFMEAAEVMDVMVRWGLFYLCLKILLMVCLFSFVDFMWLIFILHF